MESPMGGEQELVGKEGLSSVERECRQVIFEYLVVFFFFSFD